MGAQTTLSRHDLTGLAKQFAQSIKARKDYHDHNPKIITHCIFKYTPCFKNIVRANANVNVKSHAIRALAFTSESYISSNKE